MRRKHLWDPIKKEAKERKHHIWKGPLKYKSK
jgi:hypothetical protein